MKSAILYVNKISLKALFISELLIGSILLFIFISLFINEIYLDIWILLGPLVGLALIVTGLTGSKIKEIKLNSSTKSIVIKRESLLKSRTKQIDPYNMSVELKTATGNKNSLIPRLKLIILGADKEIEELKSGFLSMNNSEIKRLYQDLKSIVEITNGNKAYKEYGFRRKRKDRISN